MQARDARSDLRIMADFLVLIFRRRSWPVTKLRLKPLRKNPRRRGESSLLATITIERKGRKEKPVSRESAADR
jgi:hypothetical protein